MQDAQSHNRDWPPEQAAAKSDPKSRPADRPRAQAEPARRAARSASRPEKPRQALPERLGIAFDDERLLKSALTHRSFLNERPERNIGLTSNERLEFLGDAVLNFLATSWLYRNFPGHKEGELTTMRAALVKTSTLARFARELHLGSDVRISRGEDTNAARDRPALLADLFEAVLGAIYLDQGLETAQAFVEPFLQQEAERIQSGQTASDYRTRLQELAQARYNTTPSYHTVQVTGPDHCREFTVEVAIGEERLGTGTGSSKQNAAQEAARRALDVLNTWNMNARL